MAFHGPDNNSKQRLDSWASIAQYLGRSSRTVQRWHADYHLPIYRLGGTHGSVFAYALELDRWMWSRGQPESGSDGAGANAGAGYDFSKLTTEPTEEPHSANNRSAEKRSEELVALGRKSWEMLSHSSVRTVTRLFREAADLHPRNADAFAGLAMALIAEGFFNDVPMQTATAAARTALQRALDINPGAPSAVCPRAWLGMITEKNWTAAKEEFERNLRARRPDHHVAVGRALIQMAEGFLGKGADLMRRALQDYPLNGHVWALSSWMDYLSCQFTKALAQIKDARSIGESGPILDAVESLSLIQLEGPRNHIPRIEALAEESPDHEVLQGTLGYAYAASGEKAKAQHLLGALTDLRKNGRLADPYAIALVFLGLDERQKGVQWLENSYNDGSLWSLGFPFDPLLAPLQNDPYFRLFWSKVLWPGKLA